MSEVFVHGCFDVFHTGHLRFLQWAGAMGRVVVGLRSDLSVKARHGREPAIGHFDRAELLMALDCVSDVYLFDEESPAHLIGTIHPTTLAYGPTQAPDDKTRLYVATHQPRLVRSPTFEQCTADVIKRVISVYSRDT